MNNHKTPLDQVKEEFAFDLALFNTVNTYFASYLYFSFLFPPIDSQGNQRETDKIVGLAGLSFMVSLAAVFELIKYKKLLSLSLEIKLDRAFRHSVHGILVIALLVFAPAFLAGLFASTETIPTWIIDTANWLEERTILEKLAITVPAIVLKSLATVLANYFEFQGTKTNSESLALLQSDLMASNSRKPNWVNLLRILGLPISYLEGVSLAALVITMIESFNIPLSYQDVKYAASIVPAISTLMIFDHPVHQQEMLRKSSRFLLYFLFLAPVFGTLLYSAFLDILSFKNNSINLSDPTSAFMWAGFGLLMTFSFEARFAIAAALNDKKPFNKAGKTALLIQQLALGALVCAVAFPKNPTIWSEVLAFSTFSFMSNELINREKFTWQDFVLSIPKHLMKAAAMASASWLLVESLTGPLIWPFQLYGVSIAGSFAIADYLAERYPLISIVNKCLSLGLISSLGITTTLTLPMIKLKHNDWLPLSGFLASGLGAAIWQFWRYKKQAQVEPIIEEQPNVSVAHDHPVQEGLLTLFSMLFLYNVAEKFHGTGDSLVGQLFTCLIMMYIAARVGYSLHRNNDGKGIAEHLSKFGLCRPRQRAESLDDKQIQGFEDRQMLVPV